MDRMGSAAQLGLGLNTAEAGNQSTLAGLGTTAAELPWLDAEKLAALTAGLWGNSTTTTQKNSGGLGQMLAQAAGAAAGSFAASDRRLKHNKIGRAHV